jgi:NADP-dependent alcohol dehydrogenase
MIGHKLIALFGIDHAQTLAVVLPSLLWERREAIHSKLLQYGERVLGITSGSESERIQAAIDATRAFFERMVLPTRLPAYGVGLESIDTLVAQFTSHGMTALGEHRDLTPEDSRRVLAGSF